MAVLQSSWLDVPVGETQLRALVTRPRTHTRPLPVVLAWSDIFQLTPPHVRLAQRIASRGFLVVSPELYTRVEPAGTVLDFDRDRQRAIDASSKVQLASVDEDTRAVMSAARSLPGAHPSALFVCGWCFGGHVAFRAALDPLVRAAACCYPTGLHSDTLGAAQGTARTLERSRELRGELLLVWGRGDPHIPAEGRRAVHNALDDAGARYEARLFEAEHTFMRDEGARYNPAAADEALEAVVKLFQRATD